MHLDSTRAQTVTVAGRTFTFAKGETIHTESSYKYTVEFVPGAGRERGLAADGGVDRRAPLFLHPCAQILGRDRGPGGSPVSPPTDTCPIADTPMPICEADPWRLQYFENIPCPADVLISDRGRGIVEPVSAPSLGLRQGGWWRSRRASAAAPHGVDPPAFPVFSKPITNLKGMGVGSRILRSATDYAERCAPGHMWMALLEGRHVVIGCRGCRRRTGMVAPRHRPADR